MNARFFNINILDHPSRQTKTVFFFTQKEHSEYFKQLLTEKNISYEFEIDEESGKHYFGIDNRYFSVVKNLNYLVFAKFRKPFIESSFLKYLLIGVTALFVILAIIGYWVSWSISKAINSECVIFYSTYSYSFQFL